MKLQKDSDRVLIIDFGSQVTKLIARRIRELGVYSEIITPKDVTRLKKYNDIKGIILSGGPSTVTSKKFESVPKELFEKKIPILGICYGLQLISKIFGGKIKTSKKKREFGRATLFKKKEKDKKRIWRSRVNKELIEKYQKIFNLIDKLIFLKVPSFKYVFKWRLLQEKKL